MSTRPGSREVPGCSHIERRGRLGSVGLLVALVAIGCGGPGAVPPGSGGGTSTCVGTPVVTPKRVVRLSEHQLWSAYTALFGASAAAVITRNEDPPSLLEREFPPISGDRKSTRLNSSHVEISYAVFCLKKKKK